MSNNEETEFKFTLKNDYAFKRLLGVEENKAILKDFLDCVLDFSTEDFEDIELLDKELKKDQEDDKTGILDIKVRLKNGRRIDIEMQLIWDASFVLRSIFYLSKMYISDFKSGAPYSSLHKCVSINIVGEGYDLDDDVHSTYFLINPKTGRILTDFVEFHFLNLKKIKDAPISSGCNKEERLINWLKFIDTDNRKERDMLANTSVALKILNEQINELTFTPEERYLYESRMKLKSDIATIYESSFNKGLKEGIEKGRTEGIEKGRAEGIEKGREEGAYKNKLETAKKLIEMGLPLENIASVTGLNVQEIVQLKAK